MKVEIEQWPPYCCVPAFCERALLDLGVEVPSRSQLARIIGVSVPVGVENPWHLPVAASDSDAGIAVEAALLAVNHILKHDSTKLRMCHVRFKNIALGLYPDVAVSAIERGCAVGVGLDWRSFTDVLQAPMRHLVRVVDTNDKGVYLRDDSSFRGHPPLRLTWDEVEQSVLSINDGFWIIGSASEISAEL